LLKEDKIKYLLYVQSDSH